MSFVIVQMKFVISYCRSCFMIVVSSTKDMVSSGALFGLGFTKKVVIVREKMGIRLRTIYYTSPVQLLSFRLEFLHVICIIARSFHQ